MILGNITFNDQEYYYATNAKTVYDTKMFRTSGSNIIHEVRDNRLINSLKKEFYSYFKGRFNHLLNLNVDNF